MSVPNKTEESRNAAVYRLYDTAGTLLYIGSAYDPEERVVAHRKSAWGGLIARRTDEWHATRESAYEAEMRAIRAESPPHNIAGTTSHVSPSLRGAVQKEAARARWRAVGQARSAGASREEARRAGALAEIEHLEASGMFVRYAAALRETLSEGGTCTQWGMSID